MGKLGHVLLHVNAGDANSSLVAVGLNVQMSPVGYGHVVLGDLVALHKVGVGVVLPVELGAGGDVAVEGKTGGDGVFNGLSIDYRKHARHSQANGTDQGVGFRALVVGAA